MGAFGANSNTILSSCDDSCNPVAKKEKFYTIISALRSLIGDDLLKERLEIETLESLRLIAKKEVFNQKYIKIKTRLFYKQQKFNLLREESEGYSKLIAELGENNLDSKILENIQSLIGCFNLDPNRVLDIILESFENSPNTYKTFIGLLKHYKAEEDTICQIIGFKFQSLHQQQQTNKQDNNQPDQDHQHISQDSLYKITSYLLKNNIIDLDLLMPHLYPSEQQIQQSYKEEFESARQYAKKLNTVNLSDTNTNQMDTGSSQAQQQPFQSNQQVDEKLNQLLQQQLQANKIDNQKVNLVKHLIEIGDYKTALKIIEKLPQWYLASCCDISIAICKSIDTNLVDPIYKKYNLLSPYLKEKYLNTNSILRSKSISKGLKANLNNNKLNHLLDELTAASNEMDLDDLNTSKSAKQNLSSQQLDDYEASIFEQFNDTILPLLCALGPGVSYDTLLLTKLIRICVSFLDSRKFSQASSTSGSIGALNLAMEHNGNNELVSSSSCLLNNQNENSNNTIDVAHNSNNVITCTQILSNLSKIETDFYNQIYTLLNEVLMPSLSMISMNPCLAIELWNLMKLFPYEMRYHLYNNWRLSTYKHFPRLIRTKAECTEKIKYLLKRLTKENVKIHGRQIGKLSHNNPIIVCDYILTQIQRYDNFILPVVDSLKFMTPLSYDVLSYCIIIAISDADKEKMKHDSTNLSSWLQSIATFCALAFKKYPIELIAMIQYVINQLKNKKSYDLLILQEIVQKMCGIEVLSEVNDLQLEAMAGGDLLRQEAGYFNPIRNIKKCANRLKEALADHGLILPLCILLSQQRDYIVFADQAEREREALMPASEKRHLKLTGCLYDQCQDSLVQFSQFLSSTLTTEEYIHIFPKIDSLVNEYHVSPDVAFFLSRPMYAHHIQSKYDELRRLDRNIKTTEKPSKTQRYLEAIDVVMQPVIDLARSLHSQKIWEDMSPLFYTTFWTLSMSDCFVPSSAYEKQRISLKHKLNALDDNQELTSTKKKKEKEKIVIMLEKLAEEEQKQKDHVQHVKARFEKEKDFWFPQKNRAKNETITVFLQLCIFSRCLFTQIDAYYCSKFIHIIHSLKTPNFSTIICYDRIFSDISYSIASLTDNEARRYGRFLVGLLETVMSWHSDPNTFETECAQHPGFLTVFRNTTNSSTSSSSSAYSNRQEQLDYENYRHVCHKWHYKLTKSFIVCIESKEYLQMRNALIILTKILPHYPKLTNFSAALEKRVDIIKQAEKDKRQDIYTLASAYLGQLKQRKSHLIDESKFHIKKQTTPTPTSHSHDLSSDRSRSSSTTQSKQSQPSQSKMPTSQHTDSSKFKQPQNPNKQAQNTVPVSSQSSSSLSSNSTNTATNNSTSKQSTNSISSNSTINNTTNNSSNSSSGGQVKSSNSINNAADNATSNSNNVINTNSNSNSKIESSSKSQNVSSSSNNSNSKQSSSSSSTSSSSSISLNNLNNNVNNTLSSQNDSSLVSTAATPQITPTNNQSSSRIVIKSSSNNIDLSTSPIASKDKDESTNTSRSHHHHHHHTSNSTNNNHHHHQGHSTSNGNSGSRTTSSNGSKNKNSPNSSQNQQLTPTKNGTSTTTAVNPNDYSPTSSVSSDEWPQSPKRSNNSSQENNLSSQSQQQQQIITNNNHHSRSTSPNSTNKYSSTNNGYSSSSYNKNSSSSSAAGSLDSKAKRNKTSDEIANGSSGNKSYSSSNSNNNANNGSSNYSSKDSKENNNEYQPSSQSSTSSSSSSSKRKSSRDRDRSDKEREVKDSKEKKEHRKREHSSDINNEVQHKRSKSDEAKKKSNSTSGSSQQVQQQSQQQQQQQLPPQQLSNSGSSGSSNSKRSSKSKHESSSYNSNNKEDYQLNNSPIHNSNNNQSSFNSNSSKPSYRSSSTAGGNDDRRSSSNHDNKNSSYGSSYKDKK